MSRPIQGISDAVIEVVADSDQTVRSVIRVAERGAFRHRLAQQFSDDVLTVVDRDYIYCDTFYCRCPDQSD